MAPGDVDNVYVNLNNTGTLASLAGMTLWVAGSPVNALTDGTAAGEGLAVTITQCSVGLVRGRSLRRVDHVDPGADPDQRP